MCESILHNRRRPQTATLVQMAGDLGPTWPYGRTGGSPVSPGFRRKRLLPVCLRHLCGPCGIGRRVSLEGALCLSEAWGKIQFGWFVFERGYFGEVRREKILFRRNKTPRNAAEKEMT
jgi:hypothetical protein